MAKKTPPSDGDDSNIVEFPKRKTRQKSIKSEVLSKVEEPSTLNRTKSTGVDIDKTIKELAQVFPYSLNVLIAFVHTRIFDSHVGRDMKNPGYPPVVALEYLFLGGIVILALLSIGLGLWTKSKRVLWMSLIACLVWMMCYWTSFIDPFIVGNYYDFPVPLIFFIIHFVTAIALVIFIYRFVAKMNWEKEMLAEAIKEEYERRNRLG